MANPLCHMSATLLQLGLPLLLLLPMATSGVASPLYVQGFSLSPIKVRVKLPLLPTRVRQEARFSKPPSVKARVRLECQGES